MFNGKVILITGGTGSFGKKYTEVLLKKYKPKKIIIFSRDELKQYEMQQEYQNDCMRYFLGDVRDPERLDQAMNGVDYVKDYTLNIILPIEIFSVVQVNKIAQIKEDVVSGI